MKKIIKTFSIVLMLLVLVGCAEQKIHMDVTESEVTLEVTDIVNSSIREESQVEELTKKYEALGYTVKKYDGSEDGMVGVIYSKKFKLSDVSSDDAVEFHLETIGSTELKDPKFFKAEKGLFGTTYKATMVYDTNKANVDGFSKEELMENASSITISYSVTLPSAAKSNNASSVDEETNTYTWFVTYGESANIDYVFKVTSPLLYVVIAVVAIGVIGVVAIIVMKNKKKNNNQQQPVYSQPVQQAPVQQPVVNDVVPVTVQQPVVNDVVPETVQQPMVNNVVPEVEETPIVSENVLEQNNNQ